MPHVTSPSLSAPSPAPTNPPPAPAAAPGRDLRALVCAAVLATADTVRDSDPAAAEALLRAASTVGAHAPGSV